MTESTVSFKNVTEEVSRTNKFIDGI